MWAALAEQKVLQRLIEKTTIHPGNTTLTLLQRTIYARSLEANPARNPLIPLSPIIRRISSGSHLHKSSGARGSVVHSLAFVPTPAQGS